MGKITYTMSDDAVLVELGSRIGQKRLSRNIKQSRMAQSLGVSVPTYRNLEKHGVGGMELFVAALRALNDLESLEHVLPGRGESPMDMLLGAKPAKKRVSTRGNVKVGNGKKSFASERFGTAKVSATSVINTVGSKRAQGKTGAAAKPSIKSTGKKDVK
ncbi:MAG: DNA-binding XRE family transcriptional regulator [Pseudohongiellaceae bacterium]|jgi:DNA-binding XRE family transcriptional regulator